MPSKINVALVGYGYWGKIFFKYLDASKFISILWVCTKNSSPELKKNRCKTSNNFNEILNDDSVELVVIITPLKSHYQLAKKALLSKKNVFIEKPTTNSYQKTKELFRIAKNKDKLIITDFPYVYSESLIKLKSLVKKQENIKKVDISFSQLGRFGRGDVLYLLGTHILSILNSLFSIEKINIKSNKIFKTKSSESPEVREILFIANKIQFNVSMNLLSVDKRRIMTIYGDKKVIQWSPDSENSLAIFENNIKEKKLNEIPMKIKFDEKNNLRNVVSYLVDTIKKESIPNNELALKVQKHIEVIIKEKIK